MIARSHFKRKHHPDLNLVHRLREIPNIKRAIAKHPKAFDLAFKALKLNPAYQLGRLFKYRKRG